MGDGRAMAITAVTITAMAITAVAITVTRWGSASWVEGIAILLFIV